MVQHYFEIKGMWEHISAISIISSFPNLPRPSTVPNKVEEGMVANS
jgi:hypothetical protein